MSSYTAETVEPLIAEMLQVVEDSLALAKSASDELASLKEAHAAVLAAPAAAPVVLEKVASIPDEEIETTLDTLVNNGFLDEKDRAGVASAIKDDPGVAMKIASRIATLSVANASQGAGVTKSASAKEAAASNDPDGWLDGSED